MAMKIPKGMIGNKTFVAAPEPSAQKGKERSSMVRGDLASHGSGKC